MTTVRIRERGQVTIPAAYRKELGLHENDTLNTVKIDDMVIFTPKRAFGDTVARKVEAAMKQKGLTLDDLLSNLREQRSRYSRKPHGKGKD